MRRGWCPTPVAVAVASVVAFSSAAPRAAAAPPPAIVRTPVVAPLVPPERTVAARGLTGELILDAVGPPLRAAVDQGARSSMVVRVTEITDPPAPTNDSTAVRRYRIEFIGAVAGVFDLRDNLERRDGSAIGDLPPLTVEIVSELPPQHGTDLFQRAREPYVLTSRYLIAMGLLAAAWIAVPIVVLLRRALRRHRVVGTIVAPSPPTLADQLRPLVEAAMVDGLTVDERGRLELLVMGFWRERLGLDALSPADAAARLRSHPESSPLLLALERWLHARGAGSPRPKEDVAALLVPYRAAPAQPEPQSPPAERSTR